MSHKLAGLAWEKQAIAYLQAAGLKLETKNYHCRMGEIDLIMSDNDTLIFVEVRYRNVTNYGDSAASVNRQKQRKIINTAKYYLQENNLYDKRFCRFDVIAFDNIENNINVEWIPNAFC